VTVFDTIESVETEFGDNNFLEIARKVSRSEDGERGVEFISITRGYIDAQGARRYKMNLTVSPDDMTWEDIEDLLTPIGYPLWAAKPAPQSYGPSHVGEIDEEA
jgi:hypothetical protein